jgi:arabinofuranosyltransferase
LIAIIEKDFEVRQSGQEISHIPESTYTAQAFSLRLETVITVGLVLASAVIFIAMTAALWHYTVDDAYITFRYAENLSSGWGLTFNHEPPRAEGYTSILWTLLMVIPHMLGIDAVSFSKLVGATITMGTIYMMAYGVFTAKDERRIEDRVFGAALACMLLLSFPYFPVHVVSGMETALAAFLYTITAVLFLALQDGRSSKPFLPMACLLLGLTRPEANLYSVVLLALALYCTPTSNRLRFAVWCFAFYILPGVCYFAWRYHYYGLLWPLPFYIKSNNINFCGLSPTMDFAKDLAFGFGIPLVLLLFNRRALLLIPILLVSAYFLNIEHIMGFGHRYFFPFVPILSMLSGLGVSLLTAKLPSKYGVWIRTAFLLLISIAAASGFLATKRISNSFLTYSQGMDRAHIALGHTLAKVQWSSTPIIAIGDAGAVPYYSRLETIDTFGLNDPDIATHFHADRSGYLLSKNPTIVVFISFHDETFESPLEHEKALYRSCIDNGYTRQVTFMFGENYYLWVLWRPDSQDAHILDEVLVKASQQNHSIGK